ncbi:MAG: hypothetical protein AAFX99_23335, partial [Myxococcota bacterium]
DSLTLEAVVVETEQSKLKGASPSVSPEAREALRQGKLPTQARLRIVQDQQEYAFVFKAPDFMLSGVRIPALLSEEEDEKFYERMYLIEELEAIIHDLYGEFLALRLSPVWTATLVPWLRNWVMSEEGTVVAADQYRDALAQVEKLDSVRRFVTKPPSMPSSSEANGASDPNTTVSPEAETAQPSTDTNSAEMSSTEDPSATDTPSTLDASSTPAPPATHGSTIDGSNGVDSGTTDDRLTTTNESGEPVLPPPPF